jgi:hypothetical protein
VLELHLLVLVLDARAQTQLAKHRRLQNGRRKVSQAYEKHNTDMK